MRLQKRRDWSITDGGVSSTVSRPSTDSPTALYVARQPILDDRGRVFGYELLYRNAPGDTSCTADGDLASASVLIGVVLDLGLDTFTGGR